MAQQLTADELAHLDFEDQWWRRAGAKDRAIRETLGVTPIRHYQVVARLLQHPAALAARPAVVRRLQRVVDQRRTRGQR